MSAGAFRLLALVVLIAGGCAPALHGVRHAHLPPRASVSGVPVLVQARDHCGPTSLAALLSWAGRPESPEALAPLVYLPGRSGTLPIDLPRELRARGLLAYRVRPRIEALLAEVGSGRPALVLENRGLGWAPRWHYSVLVGYDLGDEVAVLHAGAAWPERAALGTFRRTWERGGAFALLALPPGELPAGEDPEGILSALADLEESGRHREAAAGYRAFRLRWPSDWRGPFGEGNAVHAAGDREGSERAFRQAHALAPGRPEPLNNLALAVGGGGRPAEARALAAEALAKARALNVDPSPYEDTLLKMNPSGAGDPPRSPVPEN